MRQLRQQRRERQRSVESEQHRVCRPAPPSPPPLVATVPPAARLVLDDDRLAQRGPSTGRRSRGRARRASCPPAPRPTNLIGLSGHACASLHRRWRRCTARSAVRGATAKHRSLHASPDEALQVSRGWHTASMLCPSGSSTKRAVVVRDGSAVRMPGAPLSRPPAAIAGLVEARRPVRAYRRGTRTWTGGTLGAPSADPEIGLGRRRRSRRTFPIPSGRRSRAAPARAR